MHYPFFHNICGISKVGDLVSRDNIFLGSEKVLNAKLFQSQYFVLMEWSVPYLMNGVPASREEGFMLIHILFSEFLSSANKG